MNFFQFSKNIKKVFCVQKGWSCLLFVLALVMIGGLSFLRLSMPYGLTATYYANPTWNGTPILTQIESNISLVTFQKMITQGRLSAQQISIAWNGWLQISSSGEYRFYTTSDDGSSIILDDLLILDNGGYHGEQTRTTKLWLTEGLHRITISYFNGDGHGSLKVWWKDLSSLQTSIPPIAFFTRPISRAQFVLNRYTREFTWLYALSWGMLFWSVCPPKGKHAIYAHLEIILGIAVLLFVCVFYIVLMTKITNHYFPVWSDEFFYYVNAFSFVENNTLKAALTYSGKGSLWLGADTHGFAYPLFHGLIGKVFGWNNLNFIYTNLILVFITLFIINLNIVYFALL